MPRRISGNPTDLELAVLKVLWQRSPPPQTVEQVREGLAAAGRDLAYSTVITVLNILVRKQYVRRKKAGRAFEFAPLVAEQSVHRGILSDIVDRVFDGSAASVMLELLNTARVDADELKAIRKLINRKAGELEP